MPDVGTWPHLIWAFAVQPIPNIAEFLLRAGVSLISFVFIIFGLFKLTEKAGQAAVWNSNIKHFGSATSEPIVRMTEPTLVAKNLKDKQKAYLEIRQGSVVYDKFAVEVRKRKPRSHFVDGDVELSNSAIVGTGAAIPNKDDAMTHITRVAVSPIPLGWDNLMLNSFRHPDFATRLAWQMAWWSFFASTIVGVLISHFHMLLPK